MTTKEEIDYKAKTRKVWMIYTFVICCLIAFLVFVVADDNEEILFYSVMTAAFAYVFRPGKEFIESSVKGIYGVDPPPRDKDVE